MIQGRAPEAESAAADETVALQNLQVIKLEPLGEDAGGYCADGVCYVPDEQTGYADADRGQDGSLRDR